ncbi:MAG: hypothetical protein FWF53_05610 [Candidatus Azobacteroides sp.]|nr:hypothetical protein [Candidatus Azobacteroides sp.]
MDKYYSSSRWSNEIADCSMPMTFDTYGNCAFGCLYCFSQYQRALGKAKNSYLEKRVKAVNVEKVKRMFTNPDGSQFGEYIRQKKVMQWGGLSDQFDGFERKYGKTLELLRFFKEIDYPLCFSTKSVWWTKDERYTELFRGQKNWNVKFSIITSDERKAKIIEKGCPSPDERLKAIETVAKADCGGATLRLRPFIIGISTPSYTELIKQAGDCGATALSTEFFCIEQRSNLLKSHMPVFNELCGFDVMEFYKKYSVSSGYLRLNRKVKEPFIRKMKETCDNIGMRFYVSDAHFKELCHNGSCCGLPETWNYSRGQFCEALQIADKNGEVRFSDIEKDIKSLLSGFEWSKADGYNCNSSDRRAKFYGMSMYDYMKWLWNNPQSGQSPYKLFEGILIPAGKDEEGNLIYHYTGKNITEKK